MDSRITFLGHPLHAMLVVFPLGLLFTTFLFDLVFLWRKEPFWQRAAFWMMVVGEAGAVAAVVPGLLDYLAIPMPLHARETATTHLVLGVLLVALYGLQIWLRRGHAGEIVEARRYSPALVLFAAVSAVIVGLQGWLGGQLSHVHGVGVTPEARRPDMPSPPVLSLPTEDVIPRSGNELYLQACAGCHGARGEGQIGPRLAGTSHAHQLEEIIEIVRDGRKPLMPAFADQLSSLEIRSVAEHVQALMGGGLPGRSDLDRSGGAR